jgi:hypothetical protein
MLKYCALMLMLLTYTSSFAAQPDSVYVLDDVTTSPMSDIIVENYRLNWNKLTKQQSDKVDEYDSSIYSGQIWLSDAKNQNNRVLLMSYPRESYDSHDFIFSPDEAHLAVNSQILSDHASVSLVKRKTSLKYEFIASLGDHDDNDPIWKYFDSVVGPYKGQKVSDDLDHIYARAVCWSEDGSALLLTLSGAYCEYLKLLNWYCVYDLTTKKPTLDLNCMNRNTLRKHK